jgi:hypothetical protein
MMGTKLTPLPAALGEFAVVSGATVYRHVCPRGHGHVLYILGDDYPTRRAAPSPRWRLFCTGGCIERDILRAFGLPPDALKPPRKKHEAPIRYSYVSPDGEPLFDVLRRPQIKKGGQRFYQRDRGGGFLKGHLYRLPEMLAAPLDEPVFWPEGEKDVETLRAQGLTAVTTAFGAYSYDPAMAQYLAGRTVVILPDNDPPGKTYAEAVAKSLEGVAKHVVTIQLHTPPKEDVSYWLEHDGSVQDLLRMAGMPEFFRPTRAAPPSAAATGRLGRLEMQILLALDQAKQLRTDALPMLVAGLPGAEHWNARAKEPIMRYPDVPRQQLTRARAAISRALKTLAAKSLIRRNGRIIRPTMDGWLRQHRAAAQPPRGR